MAPDGGGGFDLRASRLGLAPVVGSSTFHIFRPRSDEDIDYTPGAMRIKRISSFCGAHSADSSPAEVPGYIRLADTVDELREKGYDKRIPEAIPKGERLCHGCEMNFLRSREAPVLPKKGAAARASAEIVKASVVEARKQPGSPAVWRVTFRRMIAEREYVADTPQLRDHDRFATWWMQTFHSALILNNEVWAGVLEAIGEKTRIDETGEINEGELMREAALSFLSRYRIVGGVEAMGMGYGHTVFQKDGKTWLVCGELLGELRKLNFEADPSRVRELLHDVIKGVGRQFEIHRVNRRCWPVDPKMAGIPEEVLALEENEMLVQPDPKAAEQKTLTEGDDL